MPLRLKLKNQDSEQILDIIEYQKNGESSYFKVKNKEETSINIKYIPIKDCGWDKNRFDIFLFENPYMNAENDVFEVFENTLDERLGWIFPITILESNDNDFVDVKNLNNYKFITYQKLLEQNLIINEKENSFDDYKLSEIFNESIIICVLNKDATNKIINFDINNYILSLYDYNYLIFDGVSKAKPLYDKSDFLRLMREERKRITLRKSNYEIFNNEFTNSLFFNEHLLQSDSYLVRFILLYQIIEHFISIEFDSQFTLCLDEYSNQSLPKNDLKENIINLSKERKLISDIILRIPINPTLNELFISECNLLFDDINYKSKKNNLSDMIYNLRNLVIHRFRELTNKKESLERIMEIFERLMIEVLINYKSTDDLPSS